MSDEIKEMLFLLHNDILTESGKRKLEDYITNLQSKIKAYELFDNQKIAKQQEENERLRNQLQQKENIIKEVREYINNIKPLNEEETDIKEMLKEAYLKDNIKDLEINFKTICHLEDFEKAIWNIKEILDKGEENK